MTGTAAAAACPLARGGLVGTVVHAEAVAMARIGTHRIRQAGVGERAACQAHDALQRVVDHDAARPQRVEQLVLGHHALAVAHEIAQQIEHARLQLQLPAVRRERTPRLVQLAISEAVGLRLGVQGGTIELLLLLRDCA